MSHSNPFFKHPERATYEFGKLLRDLPPHLHGTAKTDEQSLAVEAAELHALNSSDALLRGLQSLGHVLWAAGSNKENEVDAHHFASVGLLISEVALQLQHLDEFRQEVLQHELRAAKGE